MDEAMKRRVMAELSRNGWADLSEDELGRLAEKTVIGASTALRMSLVDVYEVFTRDSWPGRALVWLSDRVSALAAAMERRLRAERR